MTIKNRGGQPSRAPAWVGAVNSVSQSVRGTIINQKGINANKKAEDEFEFNHALRQEELGKRAAQGEIDAYRLRRMQQNGATAISDAAAGIMDPSSNELDPMSYEAIQQEVDALPGDTEKEWALGYASTKITEAIRQQRMSQAQSAIDKALQPGPNGEEPLLTPEQADQMRAELEDASMPDKDPDAILGVLRNQKTMLGRERAALTTMQRTTQRMMDLTGDAGETVRNVMDIQDDEWDERVALATLQIENYTRFHDQVTPIDALKEIKAILFAPPSGEALRVAKTFPQWSQAESFEERELLVDQARKLLNPNAQRSGGGGVAQLADARTDANGNRVASPMMDENGNPVPSLKDLDGPSRAQHIQAIAEIRDNGGDLDDQAAYLQSVGLGPIWVSKDEVEAEAARKPEAPPEPSAHKGTGWSPPFEDWPAGAAPSQPKSGGGVAASRGDLNEMRPLDRGGGGAPPEKYGPPAPAETSEVDKKAIFKALDDIGYTGARNLDAVRDFVQAKFKDPKTTEKEKNTLRSVLSALAQAESEGQVADKSPVNPATKGPVDRPPAEVKRRTQDQLNQAAYDDRRRKHAAQKKDGR
jgi:hypothetical protein